MNNDYINKILNDSAENVLLKLEDNSIDLVLTDPPYFLDKLDNNWNNEEVSSTKNHYTIKSLPAGMKFSKQQGIELYRWYLNISKDIFRVLKPGGFFFSFSSPRLYHRMASAVDDAGFEIRDSFIWLYTRNQVKAMSLNHFIDKMDIDEKKKNILKEKLDGWKTPQIKSCFEPIVMGQKPTDGTFLNNFLEYSTGLFNTNAKVGDNMYPANVLSTDNIDSLIDKTFLIGKPDKKEKGDYNIHKTVKPLALCEHLIKLSVYDKSAIILDPFAGSGTTAVAAKKLGYNYIGIDINKEYVDIAEKRLSQVEIKENDKNSNSTVQLKMNLENKKK